MMRKTDPIKESQQEFLASIVDSSADAILSKTLDGIITSWNHGAEVLYGYTAAEVIGQSVAILTPLGHEDEIPAIMSRIKRGEKIDHYETTRRKKDGTLIHISLTVSPVRDATGKLVGASAIGRDITEERRMRRERFFLASIVDYSDDAILTKDMNGNILTWNKGAEKLYGYSPDEVVGKHVSIIAPLDRKDEIEYIMNTLKDGQTIDHYETLRRRKDGTLLDISVTVSPIIDEGGNIVAASAIARDITERKRIENLVRTQLEEKKILIQEVYHRVKNNLQLICSMLELRAQRKGERDSAFQDSIQRIHAMALVHEKMYYSESLAQVDLTSYLNNLFEPLISTYSQEGSRIDFEVRGDPCTVTLNMAVPLGLIFNELITNSIKYAFPAETSGKIDIELKRTADLLQIRFSDNGVGLPESMDPLTTTTFGFRIIRLLVQQLDGTIETMKSNGTTFRLTFDLTK